jgi:FtsZ-interacting cell division protein ZipA
VKHPSVYTQKDSGNTFVHILVGIVIIAIVVLVGWRVAVRNDKSTTKTVSPTASTAGTSSTTPATSSTTPAISPGTNNTSLTSDLNSVNAQLSGQSVDNSSVNAALNDQKNEITVPTN